MELPEHAAPESKSQKMYHENTPEEDKAIKLVDKLFKEAKSKRDKYDERWTDFYRMFRGKQWRVKRPSYRSTDVINLIFQTIQSQVPILTDTYPRIGYTAKEPSDIEFAEIMNDVVQADWKSNNWLLNMTEVVYDAHFFGAGTSSLLPEQDPKTGLFKICYSSEDPFHMFPDPDATDVNVKGDYFVCAKPKSVAKLKKEYPDKADLIKADMEDLAIKKLDRSDITEIRSASTADGSLLTDSYGNVQVSEEIPKALVLYCYMKDDETIEEESQDEESGEIIYTQKKKYPNGRVVIKTGKTILYDGPNELEHGEFPYQRLLNYILPREFWGISEVEQLESPQMLLNKLVSFTMDVLSLMGNPIYIVDKSAGIDVDNLTNRPGLIVEKNPGSEVRRESGVQLQPYVINLIEMMKGYVVEIAGSTDVSRGIKPENIQSGTAISQLVEASLTRLRQKSRNLDAYLQSFGKQYLSLVLQYYTAPQVYRLTNKDGVNKYFKFSVETKEDADGNQLKVANVTNYKKSEDTGQYFEEPTKQILLKGELDVEVTTSSTLPFSKLEKESKAFALYDRKLIDPEEVFKITDYPNAKEVMQRMDQKAQQQAQMQMGGGAPAPAEPVSMPQQ